MALSLSRVSPRGLLVFHVSNRFYDLRPVLATAARDLGLAGRWRERLLGLQPGEDPSRYVVLARDEALLRSLDGRGWRTLRAAPDDPRWTDDHADPLALWRRARRE